MSGKIIVGEKVPLRIKQRTLGEFMFEMADIHAHKIAQIDYNSGEEETFASVKMRSIRAAIEMKKRGITSKDIIGFCCHNILENAIAVAATAYLGAAFNSLDPALSVRHSRHLLNIIKPKFMFVEDKSLDLIEKALKNADFETTIIVFGDSTKYSTFDEFLKPSKDEETFKPTIVDSNETATILYSSGTTGLPKAVCLSHLNLLYRTNEQLNENKNEPSKLALMFTTLYWISGVMVVLSSFASGYSRLLLKRFDPEEILTAISKYKPSFLLMTQSAAYDLTNFPRVHEFDTRSVQLFLILGGRISAPARRKLQSIFKTSIITSPYATSETGTITHFELSPQTLRFNQEKIDSCGKVYFNCYVKVVDPETEQILGPNQRGEIRCKSPTVMLGYINMDPKEVFDDDGYYKTGDIGYFDNDECFFIVDRIKEMFKYRNNYVVPTAIEMILLEHPAIAQACVFGLPAKECEEYGDYPSATVVLKSNHTVSAEEIFNFVAQRVLEWERLIGGINIVDSIPVTPTGKLLRRLVREQSINDSIKNDYY